VLVQGATDPAPLICGLDADEMDVSNRIGCGDEPEELGDDPVARTDYKSCIAELVHEERVVIRLGPPRWTAGGPEVRKITKDLQEVLMRCILDHEAERSEGAGASAAI
jgi:hypothetical protein